MKIRNGFVSNSSSSSFVVAFDKKPKNADQVLKFLFGPAAKPYDPFFMYDYTTTKGKAADQVFKDIQGQARKTKHVSREELIELFSRRYHLNCYPARMSPIPSSDVSSWYGVDFGALMEWHDFVLNKERLEDDHRDEEERYICSKIGACPRCPYDDPRHEAWEKARSDLWENDEGLKELQRKRWGTISDLWDKEAALKRKIAEADVDAFLKDNEGCKLYRFEYCDEGGGFFCIMEHGGVFKRLPHVRISHH